MFYITDAQSALDFLSYIKEENLTLVSFSNSIAVLSNNERFHLAPEHHKLADRIPKFKAKPEKPVVDCSIMPITGDGPFKNDLIFGKNKTEGIVAAEVVDGYVWLFNDDGDIFKRLPFKYWLLTRANLKGYRQLKGKNYYNNIIEYTDEGEFVKRRTGMYKQEQDFFTVANHTTAAYVRLGFTNYKGLQVSDVSVLSFDIETSGLKQDQTSYVYLISNTFRKKGVITKKLFSVDEYGGDDLRMIEDWCKWVQKMNPSTIIGHNIFMYDLPYLDWCYGGRQGFERHLPLGRDCSDMVKPHFDSKFRKDGSQEYSYFDYHIFGREIVDTFFLAVKYDIARNYFNYRLKNIVQQEGLEKPGRTFYDASTINTNWSNPKERELIKQYCIDDSDDALALYDLMIPAYFYYAQNIPMSFQRIINSASGKQIDLLLCRAYLQQDMALPKAMETEKYGGGVSFGIPGIYSNVFKIDVASLYPSIIRQYQLYNPEKDPEAYFLKMVDVFTIERLAVKQLAQDTGDRYHDHRQNAMKIIINSSYGLLGAGGLLFNDPSLARFVTNMGRDIIKTAVTWATGKQIQELMLDYDEKFDDDAIDE